MKESWIRVSLVLLAIIAGFLIGKSLQSGKSTNKKSDAHHNGKSTTRVRETPTRFHASTFLQRETKSLWNTEDFVGETERLYRETKSPLRTRFTLSYYVQQKSFDELVHLLENRQILNEKLLGETGIRLAETDPVRALELILVTRTYRVNSIDQEDALRGQVMQTVAIQHPMLGLKALQKMERGGSQMANSLHFSGQLAWFKPEFAVKHFDELVVLRNMRIGGSLELPRDTYADAIMESWLERDREAAIAYTEGLPDGPKKTALQWAIDKRSTQQK